MWSVCQATSRVCGDCMVPVAQKRYRGTRKNPASRYTPNEWCTRNLPRATWTTRINHSWGETCARGRHRGVQIPAWISVRQQGHLIHNEHLERAQDPIPELSMPFSVPSANLDLRKYFSSVRGASLWNSLPSELRECTSVNSFKNAYDRYFASAAL